MRPPLDGIRILDFTHGVAGPYASMLLADLGADVLKVEKPGRGDATRYMNVSRRFRAQIPESGGDYFLAINRNKRSLALDLQSARGREIALSLGEQCDLVLQNFRPGVMERLGLGFADFRAVNPGVIYGSISAYGREGPLAHQPGMDVAVQARSGVMAITGTEADGPVKPGASLADFAGGVHLTTALLAALVQRGRTGEGQDVHVSLLDATMLMLINYSVAVVDGKAQIKPMGSGHPQLVPFQAFPTADGFIVIATGTNKLFVELCRVLGHDEWAADPRFRTNPDRVEHRGELVPLMSDVTRQRSTGDWIRIFEQSEIPCAPVNDLETAFRDPQLQSNGMLVEMMHPTYGGIHLLGIPYAFSGAKCSISRHPPRLGEHTEEILRELLHLPDRDLDELHAQGVI